MNALTTLPPTHPAYIPNRSLLRDLGVRVPEDVAEALSLNEVRDLIDAAGPLTIRDIAGGLAIPVLRAAARVGRMVYAGALKRDEFGRYRLWNMGTTR